MTKEPKRITSIFSEGRAIIFMENFNDYLVLGFSDNRLEIYNPESFHKEYLGFFDNKNFAGIRKENQKLVLFFKDYEINILYENNCLTIQQNVEKIAGSQKDILKNQVTYFETKIRKDIYIIENTFMRVYFGNTFDIYVKREGGEEKVLTGNHTNWVTDACIVRDSLYTAGYDGYIRKWDLKTGNCEDAYPLKRGWILSLTFIKDNFYVGTEFGELYLIPYNEFKNIKINGGAIWNLYAYQDKLYSVSENGEIVGYSMNEKKSSYLKCSAGWINAIGAFSNEHLIAVTSRGEIIKVDHNLLRSELLERLKLWFNNLCIINEIVYAVTAEGMVVKFDLNTGKSETFKISSNQLIDICYLESQQKIGILSVEGEFIIWNHYKNFIDKIIKCNGYHFTSMTFNHAKGYIYISTFEGAIVFINTNMDYEISYRKITGGRIWKVSYCSDNSSVAYISTSLEIGICDESIQKNIAKISVNELVTTCLLLNDSLYTGNERGEVKSYPVVMEEDEKILTMESGSEDSKENDFFEKNVILFIDNSIECSRYYIERDCKLLERYNLPYVKLDLSNNEEMKSMVIKRTGWSRFPQILLWGDFIASGSVLPEMLDSGTLDNIVKEKQRMKGDKIK